MPTVNFEAVHCPLCGTHDANPLFEWRSRRIVRCHECHLVYRNPRPTASAVREAYANERTSLALEERVGQRRSRQFGRFLDSFPNRPSRLLDIGCGYGFFLKMAEERGWETVGVILNAMRVNYAKQRLHVNALLGDLRDACFPDASFDLVTLWNVLDLEPTPLDLLLEIHRILKEDGYVFIRTPNFTWQYLSFRLTGLLLRLGLKSVFEKRPLATFTVHISCFSPFTLRFLMDQAGFDTLSIRNSKPTPGDPYLGLSSGGEMLLTLAKLTVHALAQSAYLVSGGRWLVGPSLEAWARKRNVRETT